MLQKILIGLAMFLLLLAGASAYLYWKVRTSLREFRRRAEVEQKMLVPGLVKGEGRFGRHRFYTDETLGDVSQILEGWPASRERAEIVIVSSRGADFVDSDGKVKKQVRFSLDEHIPVAVARMDAGGEYGYLTRDESWAVPATLFNKEGKVMWRSETRSGVNDSASGDAYGNGKLSIVIGFNGGGGITLLDGQGKTLWQKEEGNVWHVEMLDNSGEGAEEILHSNARGQLLVRNATGNIVAQYLPGFYVSRFALARWGGESTPSHILVPVSESREDKPKFILLDAKGKKITELESPLGNLFNRLSATQIRLGVGAEYFAVLENSLSDSMLLLYGENGEIVYQEIFAGACLGIAALPKNDGERLLVGCNGNVWEYSRTLPTLSSTIPTN